MKLKCLFGVSLILVAGCTTEEEYKAQLIDSARMTCASYGFTEGHSQLPSCIQTEVNSIEQQQAIIGGAIIASSFE